MHRHTPASTSRHLSAARDIKALREVCQFRHGGTPSKANHDYWRGDIPWVSPKDMRNWCIKDTEDHISADAVANGATQVVPIGAVLVVARSGVMAANIAMKAGLQCLCNFERISQIFFKAILALKAGFLGVTR